MPNLSKNQIHTATVEGYTDDGSGVCRIDNFVVFVPFAARGDVIKVRLLKVLKTHAFGKIEEILAPAPYREEPECPAFFKCGGCDFMHISYEEELRAKAETIQNTLSRLGKMDITCDEIEPSPQVLRWRNKALFPVEKQENRVVFGFYRRHSHQVVPTCDCLINDTRASALAATVARWAEEYNIPIYDELTNAGLLRRVFTRGGEKAVHLTVVATSEKLPHTDALIAACRNAESSLCGIVLNVNSKQTNLALGEKCITLWGESALTDDLLGKKFTLSPLSFYQVNHPQAENLYRKIIELSALDSTRTALDLCCGVGTITLSLAPYCKKIVGAEIVPQAIRDAEKNAERSGIHNARFICADAGEAAKTLEKEGFSPYTVILDPPRKGMDKESLDAVLSLAPERIVYVACKVSSLARDGKYLEEHGYRITYAKGYDMFPRTANVETIALFVKCQTHQMKLHPSPFEMIKSGRKTFELRLFDEKRQKIRIGDKIIFTNTQSGETLPAEVVALHRFDTFSALYSSLPLLKCGYTEEDIAHASPWDMDVYYSPEEQKKYGVLGIEIRVIE